MKRVLFPAVVLATLLLAQSCKKDDNSKDYDVPTTYNFDNVDYSGQTTRIGMMTELSNLMKTGNTGAVVSAQLMKDMYANSGSPFANTDFNTSGKKLKDKTFLALQTNIENYMDELAANSATGVAGSNGQAGVVTSGAKAYLCNAEGVEQGQLIDKGLLGGLIYYQIVSVYLSEDKVGAQVALADRQHHWDEAFGYFGVPIDFPTNKTGLTYIGKYCNDREATLSANATIMNAFLKGRAAINNDDNATVNEQISIIRTNLEKVLAATAVHYLNEAKTNFSDDAVRNHTLSEALAFIRGLYYSPTKKISDTQLGQLQTYLGNNFYTVSSTDLDAAKNLLTTVYGL